ncbi:MAG TPA: DUF87 domain-containing protein [Bacteroidales bacterium]|nr:DUF87 domain-containing protein [Bacteroidales bacterium]
MAEELNINKIIDAAERIRTIGSPSSTKELTLDILGSAVEKKLVGELAFFKYLQDGMENYALGQITDVELRNAWLEDPTMRSLARQRGQVNPISGQQDTHLGIMTLSAVFANNGNGYEPSILGTVPQTGTNIQLANDELIKTLLYQYQQEIFYLGNVYGSKPRLPLWFKHFDTGKNGAGEAYHLGIFGKTGSGKSVLAKMVLTAYMRYPKMAILVIDPQGEFSKDFREEVTTGQFKLPLKKIADYNGKETFVISVKNLVLDRWELFEEILYESLFFERLSVPYGENRALACNVIRERLERQNFKLENLYERKTFDAAWEILSNTDVQVEFYRSEASRTRFNNKLIASNKDDFFNQYWTPVTKLFRKDRENARTADSALTWLLSVEDKEGNQKKTRPMLIIDLSKEQAEGLYWTEKIQALVIKRILDGLNYTAEQFYKGGKNLNTLVVIDEAHRLAPRETPQNESEARVRSVLVDAARTTRKYGLGWLFISQTLSSLHKEIISQLRINFFGFGLSMGTEFMALKELAGGDQNALKLYQSFRDPHSAFDSKSRQYSFMTIGPVSPLSFAGTPLFFTAFNEVQQLLDANNIRV